jgi:VWFA-related protein
MPARFYNPAMRAVVTALFVALALALPGAQPSFRAGIELVTVPVTVKHKDAARAVPEISAADLRVFEDGNEQRIDFIERDTRPLSLAIVLDVSSSMVGLSREWAVLAMDAVFKRLLPTDEVSLVVFGGWAITPIPWSPVATLPGLGWAQWVMSPETALLDAVHTSLELMDGASHGRGVVLILSDGLEIASTTSLSTVVRSRRQSETAVSAFEFDPPWDAEGHRQQPRWVQRLEGRTFGFRYMEQLVGDSGGTRQIISEQKAVAASTEAFFADLRSQYLVGYASTRPMDGKYRRIKVAAKDKDLRLRHRGGYLALAGRGLAR